MCTHKKGAVECLPWCWGCVGYTKSRPSDEHFWRHVNGLLVLYDTAVSMEPTLVHAVPRFSWRHPNPRRICFATN